MPRIDPRILPGSFAALMAAALLLVPTASIAESAPDLSRPGSHRIELTIAEIAGEEGIEAVGTAVGADEPMSWEVYVPESYNPGKPAGLLVYISPTPSGRIWRRWQDVMDCRNIIWIGANNSGNRVPVARRSIFAILAPQVASRHYQVDRERVWLSGFSGGGKVASMVAPNATGLFRGAIYFMGAEFWEDYPHHDPALIRQNRYAFVSGQQDFNLRQTRRVFHKYREAGAEDTDLIVFHRLGHRLPDGAGLERIMRFIDAGPGGNQ